MNNRILKSQNLRVSVAILTTVTLIQIGVTVNAQEVGIPTKLPVFQHSDDEQLNKWHCVAPDLESKLPDWSLAPSQTLGPERAAKLNRWRQATVILTSSRGFGSGAIVSEDGWILSNYHVVEHTVQDAAVNSTIPVLEAIFCHVVDGRVKRRQNAHDAVVMWVDPVHDLSLLKLKSLPSGVTKLDYFEIADSVEVAESCFAIGSQGGGLAWAIRSGNVAGVYQYPEGVTEYVVGVASPGSLLTRTRTDIVVTDCSISNGDSGGPLVNEDGELIGLTFATPTNLSSGSIGYHIYVDHLKDALAKKSTTRQVVPFDLWTAGNVGGPIRFPAPTDLGSDGFAEVITFYHFEDVEEQPIASVTFISLGMGVVLNTKKPFAQLPRDLWGISSTGGFNWDVCILFSVEGTSAIALRGAALSSPEIWVDSDGDQRIDVAWRRGVSGNWSRYVIRIGTAMNPLSELSPTEQSLLQTICKAVFGS